MMTINFHDTEYIWSYGHKPRGRGWWLFEFEGYEFSHTGTFSEAKKACVKHVRSIAPANYSGAVSVNVMP